MLLREVQLYLIRSNDKFSFNHVYFYNSKINEKKYQKMSHCGIEPQSDPCQGSILTIILVGLSSFYIIHLKKIIKYINLCF